MPSEGACTGALDAYALFIYWYIELRPTSRAFYGFEFASRWQCHKRLLLAGQVANRARQRFLCSQAMPSINEPLNLNWWGVVFL
jgi:hypothetical protein